MTITPAKKAILALILTNLIWGASASIFKIGLRTIPPFTFAFWRFFVATLILGAVLGKRCVYPGKTRQDLRTIVAYALLGTTINITFYLYGLKLTESINAPVIASAQPIVTLFLSIFFLRERFIPRKFIGMVAGTAGIFIIILEPLLTHGVGGNLLGNFFLLLATLGAVGQAITAKIIFPKFNVATITFWTFAIGAASFLPLAGFEYLATPTLYRAIPIEGYASLAYGALLSSLLAYCLFGYGLSKIKASDASVFAYIDPVIGTILSSILLSEPITRYFLLGTLFIFTGIFIAEGRIHYHPFPRLWQKES